MSKLWESGKQQPDDKVRRKVESFTVGDDHLLDQHLVPYDVKATAVHAEALLQAGILQAGEYEQLKKGLDEILELWKHGEFKIRPAQEDVHTAIEMYLTKKLGDTGKKIHAGRSRNDQVLTAMRLYEKDQLGEILDNIRNCAAILIKLGEAHSGIPMPGFTHTRKATLSSVGQWTGGFAELLIMQLESSAGIQTLVDRSPLGTAAGFGTTIKLDRDKEAEQLGFAEPILCATTAQLSRGWVELQLVQYLAGITSVLNRMAVDIIQFSSEAYRYFDLDPVVCTGSSIMPQKKNPDVAELIRGKHAQMDGYSSTLSGLIRNLNSGYHRDLQLTKGPVIHAFRTAREALEASVLLLNHLSFNEDRLISGCSPELFAAEAANKLVVESGWSFREAYKQIKESGDFGEDVDPKKKLQEFTQLGSPGNPGLERLKERLTSHI